jgi:hypothetical protein
MRDLLQLLGRGRMHVACIGGASVRTRAADCDFANCASCGQSGPSAARIANVKEPEGGQIDLILGQSGTMRATVTALTNMATGHWQWPAA